MKPTHIPGPSTSLGGNNSSAIQSNVLSDGALLSHSQPAREEIKKIFVARDGIYRVIPFAELSRPRPLPHYQMPAGIASAAANQMAASGSSVRVSFLDSIKPPVVDVAAVASSSSQESSGSFTREEQNTDETPTDIIAFNVGKELYVYSYRGIRAQTDLSRPIDKRVYKGTSPTCHVFSQKTYNATTCQLLIGFTLGQLQIIDPLEKTVPSPVSRLYNEDRYIDKTSVTCVRWHPEDVHIFLATYVSGNLYVYDDRIPAITSSSNGSNNPPGWQVEAEGEKFTAYSWNKKNPPRNPIERWKIGEGTIHQFDFAPNKELMGTVSHDGFLRIFNFAKRELVAVMKSYFGGLLTLSWSHDSVLVATGGEDDLLSVYHVPEKRLVVRGQAHKSWISQVKFDPYSWIDESSECKGVKASISLESTSSESRLRSGPVPCSSMTSELATKEPKTSNDPSSNAVQDGTILYRIGSVGHDTCLCFWDITNFMIKNDRKRGSAPAAPTSSTEVTGTLENTQEIVPAGSSGTPTEQQAAQNVATSQKDKPKKKRFIKRPFGIGRFTSGSAGSSNATNTTENGAIVPFEGAKRIIPVLASQISCCIETGVLGSAVCPGIKDVAIIEPVMCKKVAHDRLTVLEFRRDCVVTACQEGYICTWARPTAENNKGADITTPSVESPESEQKPSGSTAASSFGGYGSEMSNGAGQSRASSAFSNYEQQFRSPNATSTSYRVTSGNTTVYHRPTYAWQNAN